MREVKEALQKIRTWCQDLLVVDGAGKDAPTEACHAFSSGPHLHMQRCRDLQKLDVPVGVVKRFSSFGVDWKQLRFLQNNKKHQKYLGVVFAWSLASPGANTLQSRYFTVVVELVPKRVISGL